MNVARAKPGAEFGKDPAEIRVRRASRPGTARRCAPALMFPGAKIRSDEDMNRRMLDPICRKLFEIEERHFVYYGITVAAGGGEEAVYLSPAVRGSWTGSDGSPAIL